MAVQIRKTILNIENTYIEGGKVAPKALKLVAAIAIIRNPWAGTGYVEDLRPCIQDCAPTLGEMLTNMIIDHVGGGDKVEGYGKAAIVGLKGELEHASGLIHTLRFGNHYREAVGAKTFLAFTNIRGGANTALQIPLMDKSDTGRRSHYLTIHLSIPDAPADDEIVIALGASIGGRPHHRIGDRYQDLKELGHDIDNPASV